MEDAVDIAMGRIYAKEALERCRKERDRYKTERNDLLSALFASHETREQLRAAILGADDGKELDSEGYSAV
jgi:hypothetical protein